MAVQATGGIQTLNQEDPIVPLGSRLNREPSIPASVIDMMNENYGGQAEFERAFMQRFNTPFTAAALNNPLVLQFLQTAPGGLVGINDPLPDPVGPVMVDSPTGGAADAAPGDADPDRDRFITEGYYTQRDYDRLSNAFDQANWGSEQDQPTVISDILVKSGTDDKGNPLYGLDLSNAYANKFMNVSGGKGVPLQDFIRTDGRKYTHPEVMNIAMAALSNIDESR